MELISVSQRERWMEGLGKGGEKSTRRDGRTVEFLKQREGESSIEWMMQLYRRCFEVRSSWKFVKCM